MKTVSESLFESFRQLARRLCLGTTGQEFTQQRDGGGEKLASRYGDSFAACGIFWRSPLVAKCEATSVRGIVR